MASNLYRVKPLLTVLRWPNMMAGAVASILHIHDDGGDRYLMNIASGDRCDRTYASNVRHGCYSRPGILYYDAETTLHAQAWWALHDGMLLRSPACNSTTYLSLPIFNNGNYQPVLHRGIMHHVVHVCVIAAAAHAVKFIARSGAL